MSGWETGFLEYKTPSLYAQIITHTHIQAQAAPYSAVRKWWTQEQKYPRGHCCSLSTDGPVLVLGCVSLEIVISVKRVAGHYDMAPVEMHTSGINAHK